MNYITTNIRLPEEDYMKLKTEAANKRKSLAAVIREKIAAKTEERSESEISKLLERRNKLAKKLSLELKDFDVVEALRKMRYEGKW